MNVTVLGLGRMGSALAGRLLDGGHQVVVWNRSPGRADELVAAGATEAGDPAEAVESAQVVMSSLANDDAVRDLVFGRGGLADALGDRLYADCSTVSPALSAEIARAVEHFVALPILGAPQMVAEGRATYLAGGPSADVDRLQPVLESLSDSIKRFDRPGQAGAAKLASNLLLLGSIAILAEAAAAGRAGGLSDDQLSQLFGDSPILGPGVKNRVEAVITGQGPTWWTVALGEKDVRLLLEMAGAGPGLRVSPVVCDVYRAAAEAGFADDDVAAVGRLFR